MIAAHPGFVVELASKLVKAHVGDCTRESAIRQTVAETTRPLNLCSSRIPPSPFGLRRGPAEAPCAYADRTQLNRGIRIRLPLTWI